jgi:hypothetical protein
MLPYFREFANIAALEGMNLNGGLLDKVEAESQIESLMQVAQDASNPNAIAPSNIANVQMATDGEGHFAQYVRV